MDKQTPGLTYNLTTIYVQGNDQEIFEVYADESCEQTLGFVYDEEMAQLLAAAPYLLAALRKISLTMMATQNEIQARLAQAARRLVSEFDYFGEVLQVGEEDNDGTYGPTSAIETLRAAMEAASDPVTV